jgi:hypothetical protein
MTSLKSVDCTVKFSRPVLMMKFLSSVYDVRLKSSNDTGVAKSVEVEEIDEFGGGDDEYGFVVVVDDEWGNPVWPRVERCVGEFQWCFTVYAPTVGWRVYFSWCVCSGGNTP